MNKLIKKTFSLVHRFWNFYWCDDNKIRSSLYRLNIETEPLTDFYHLAETPTCRTKYFPNPMQ